MLDLIGDLDVFSSSESLQKLKFCVSAFFSKTVPLISWY